ncbi:putative holin-like toxin [Bacillus paralicheniformis]
MTVSEALQLMVSFGILVVAILSSNDKKKVRSPLIPTPRRSYFLIGI